MTRKRAKSTLSPEALELVAQRFRALGDATRLALLQTLFAQESNVQELCALTGASQANASKHLALLFHVTIAITIVSSLFQGAEKAVQRKALEALGWFGLAFGLLAVIVAVAFWATS